MSYPRFICYCCIFLRIGAGNHQHGSRLCQESACILINETWNVASLYHYQGSIVATQTT